MRRSCTLTPEQICGWACGLREQEHSPGTIKNYLRHVRSFSAWLDGREVTREAAGQWKAALVEAGYAPATVNAMLAALNRFFVFQGWEEFRVKALRLQKKLFREAGRELVRADYESCWTQRSARAGPGWCCSWRRFAPRASESAR